MDKDLLDALIRAVEFERTYLCVRVCRAQKENKMNNINIGDELKRIFGRKDPMQSVYEVTTEMDPVHGEYSIQLTLRVPGSCEPYLRSSPLYRAGRRPCAGWILDPYVPLDIHEVSKAPKADDSDEFIKPARIVYSGPKTILIWPDGTKTIVSLMEGDKPDEYAAFCSAIVKKMFGSTQKAKKFLDSIKTYTKSNPRKADKKGSD